MPNDFNIGEDWTDSDKDFSTTGALASGDQTVNGDIDATGTITAPILMQGANQVLDESAVIAEGGDIVEVSDIINAGPTAPATPFAGMLWFDTANHLLKVRNEANGAWLSIWDLTNNKPVITNLSAEITGAMLVDDTVTGTKLANAVAGNGLSKDGSENLQVNVDDATIELNSDALRLKDDGITSAKVAHGEGLINISSNDSTSGRLNGKLVAGNNVSLTENNDGANETLTIESKFRGALVRVTGLGQTIPNDAVTALSLGTEIYDTDSFHDTVTNPERLTIPSNVSRVRLSAQAYFEAHATGSRALHLYKNGNPYYCSAAVQAVSVAGYQTGISFTSPVFSVSPGDYFEAYVYQDSGGDLDVQAGTSVLTWFSIEVIQ